MRDACIFRVGSILGVHDYLCRDGSDSYLVAVLEAQYRDARDDD